MHKIKDFSKLFIISILFYSCNQCKYLDCISSDYSGRFRIVNTSNGNDLIYGQNKIYDKSQIKFYSLAGGDTTYFEVQPSVFGNTRLDSILYVNFSPKVETAFIRLSKDDIDTLKITYKIYNTKCCGTITTITNFRFNNRLDLPVAQGIQEIKK